MIDINYDYTKDETINLNTLLKAGGYPQEYLNDLVVSDFTTEQPDGYSTCKVTVPSLEHPVAAMIGDKLTLTHKFKRAHFSDGTVANTTVNTDMLAFDPLGAVKTLFNGKISDSVILKEELVQKPDIFDYKATLGVPANSNILQGTDTVNIRTMINMETLTPNNEIGVIYCPYAPVTNETNAGIAPTNLWTNEVLPGYIVGSPDGNTRFTSSSIMNPVLAIWSEKNDPIEQSLYRRLKNIVETDHVNYNYIYEAWAPDDIGLPSRIINRDYGAKDEHASTPPDGGWDTQKYGEYFFITEVNKRTSSVIPAATDYLGTLRIYLAIPKLYYAIKNFLGDTHGLVPSIRKKKYDQHVIDPVVVALGQAWLDMVPVFDDENKTIEYDTRTFATFDTLADFETATLKTLEEMLSTPDYTPTIVKKDSQSVGVDYSVSYTISRENTNVTKPYQWLGAHGTTPSFVENVIFEFVGSVTVDAGSIKEILPGFAPVVPAA